MLKCREVSAKASDWLDGELSALERLRIRLHLVACRHCRNLVNGLDTSRRIIDHHLKPEKPIASALQSRIEQAIDSRIAENDTGACHHTQDHSEIPGETDGDALLMPLEEPDDERVKRIFAEIRETEGYVPNLLRAYAVNPGLLEQTWARVKSLMYGGRLSPELKNAIAVIVSSDNGCDYCVAHHKRNLKQLGVEPEQVASFLQTADPSFLNLYERTLLHLAREANRNPHGRLRDQLNNVRDAGADNSDILETMGIMEFYCSVNRTVDSLGIPLEEQFAGEA